MAQYSDTLYTLVGRVGLYRPDLSKQHIIRLLNDRLRQVIDSRIIWSDLLVHATMEIPASYSTGTVSVTNGSATVTGAATSWPTNDKVNTTLSGALTETGYQEVTPTAMTNITADSYLTIDTGASQETVAVVEVSSTTFTAKFTKTHLTAVAIISSSLAGRQFRLANSYPMFTITAVPTATSLTLHAPWKGLAVSASTYTIVRQYFTIGADYKEILAAVDQQYGMPLRIHVPVNEINWRDPQRSSYGPPQCIVDLGPSESGNMQFEIWPCQTAARQIDLWYHRQWPEMQNDLDRPPWFMDGSLLADGAVADALRVRTGKDDAFFNPQLAEVFEGKFLNKIELAKNADESKLQESFSFNYKYSFGAGGANFWQSHDLDIVTWSL